MIEAPRRILIVKLSSIGDVLMATPAAKALRVAFPEAYIAWVVERKSADVIVGNPYLDEVVVSERMSTGRALHDMTTFARNFARVPRLLRSKRFDVSIDLQGLLRSAAMSIMSGAKHRIGFADSNEKSACFYHTRYSVNSADASIQQRHLNILSTLGVHSTDTEMHMPLSDADREFAADFFEEHGLNDQKVVVFCAATTRENKHWTEEGWSALADLLGRKYGVRSLVVGSKADIPLAQRISDGAEHKPVISAGKTTLKQAGAIIERSTAVVGVDTGLLHMSVALNRPSVGLFGASEWRHFLKRDNFVWLAKGLPCSPCHRRPTCTDIDCMRAITPEDIDAAVAPWVQ